MRGKTSGHTIEKIYPLSFVNFDHVYLLDVYKVARAKLYYIREKIGKDAKMKSLITAEQRGIDLLVIAKNNLAAELPAIIQEIADDVQIDEKIADAIVAEDEAETLTGVEETVQVVEKTSSEMEIVAEEQTSEETNESNLSDDEKTV